MRYFLILALCLFCSSCAWLATHPQVEADLEQEGIDIVRDTEKVVEDIIVSPAAPAQTPTANQ
jgi:hypothetical protein